MSLDAARTSPYATKFNLLRFSGRLRHNIDMPPVLTDLTHAARGLRKSPALAAVAIASLALGIGANVTIYSVVREMILDNLSARQPDRLARVRCENQLRPIPRS